MVNTSNTSSLNRARRKCKCDLTKNVSILVTFATVLSSERMFCSTERVVYVMTGRIALFPYQLTKRHNTEVRTSVAILLYKPLYVGKCPPMSVPDTSRFSRCGLHTGVVPYTRALYGPGTIAYIVNHKLQPATLCSSLNPNLGSTRVRVYDFEPGFRFKIFESGFNQGSKKKICLLKNLTKSQFFDRFFIKYMKIL